MKTTLQEKTLKASNTIPSVFIHYFNDQMLNNYDLQEKYSTKFLAALLAEVTRIAFLITDDRLLFPTIDVVQSRPLRLVFNHLRELFESQELAFCGSEVTAQKFISHKVKHFHNIQLYPEYFDGRISRKLEQVSKYWIKRSRSTTRDIKESWVESVTEIADANYKGKTDTQLLSYAYNALPEDLSKIKYLEELHAIPQKLDGQAFLWNLIESQKLVSFNINSSARHAIEIALAFQWLMSHLNEYQATIITHIPYLGTIDCGMCMSHSQYTINFSKILKILKSYKIYNLIRKISNESLVELKSRGVFSFFKRNFLIPKYFSLAYGINEPGYLIKNERKLIEQISQILSKQESEDLTQNQAFNCLLDILDTIASTIDESLSDKQVYFFAGGLEINTGDIINSSGVLNFDSNLFFK